MKENGSSPRAISSPIVSTGQAGGVPGLEEPQPGGILDREPPGRLPRRQCSGLDGTLDEGRLGLGQPSQLLSRQPDPIHVASLLLTLLYRHPGTAGIVGYFEG